MSKPIVFRRVARKEYDDFADWYENQKPGLGKAFTTAVQKMLNRISNQPDFYPIVIDQIREAIVTGFPFAVYYEEDSTSLVILAVFHTSRDPAVWQSRK